jgi:hypothetical protein
MNLAFVAYLSLFAESLEINLTIKYCLSGLKLFGYACAGPLPSQSIKACVFVAENFHSECFKC